LGGYDDWRVPTIKELYSLIDYRGGYTGDPATSRPYIDTKYFDFAYGDGKGLGDAAHGRRPIDVQEWSATPYVGKTMGRDDTVFGVNFADGRIKGYPVMDPANRMQTPNRLAVRLVRGNPYGQNAFKARPDVVEDHATGLMWQRKNDGTAKSWSAALSYCTHLSLAGYSDWRLPHAKELHSLVDYNRIPAIDPLFQLSDQTAYLWSSTTHLEAPLPRKNRGARLAKRENSPFMPQLARRKDLWKFPLALAKGAGSMCMALGPCAVTRKPPHLAAFPRVLAHKAMIFAGTIMCCVSAIFGKVLTPQTPLGRGLERGTSSRDIPMAGQRLCPKQQGLQRSVSRPRL
jgi:hypothetical protein